ncbi:MAG: prepilin-type N-terminal cleavage/methylation domain-containing protein, partial [Oscillospiraceae bacterium]
MKKKFLKNNRGLTLVELIIGVTIMAIIVAPLLHSFVTSAGTANKSRRAAAATTAAQNLAEQIEAMPSEKFFANAEVLGTGAQFYKSEGAGEDLKYTPLGKTLPKDYADKKYYIGIPNYNEKYDALIALEAVKKINETPVTVGNPMDAVIDMNKADDNALADYKIEGAGLDSTNNFTLNELDRKIDVEVTKTKNQYTVSGKFNYTGKIKYTETIDKKVVQKEKAFHYTETITAKVVKQKGDTAPLGVYLYFKHINAKEEKLTAKPVPPAEDFKLFLVDTQAEKIDNYKLNVTYYCVGDKSTPRVFTNMDPNKVNYLNDLYQ